MPSQHINRCTFIVHLTPTNRPWWNLNEITNAIIQLKLAQEDVLCQMSDQRVIPSSGAVTYAVECRYNAVQWSIILHTKVQLLMKSISHSSNPQNNIPYLALTGELWGEFVRIWERIDRVITAPHCIWEPILFHNVPADALARNSARPIAGKFPWSSLCGTLRCTLISEDPMHVRVWNFKFGFHIK